MQRAAHAVERRFDQLRFRLKKRLGRVGPVQIFPYRGYGSADRFFLEGRVLEASGLDTPTDRSSVWDNLRATYHRFESDEIPNVRVRMRFQEAEQITRTDDEGYFQFEFAPTASLSPDHAWHSVALRLLDSVGSQDQPVQATGNVLVPAAGCAFGVISDLDDTVIQTHATNRLKMFQLTALGNARTRLPFEGVAAFYRALHRGLEGRPRNPVFYVSSSPWNLYDLLVDFLTLKGLPKGPLLLRDLGLDRQKFIKSGHGTHKIAQVDRLFEMYPDLPFILIGDSGQHDPEIYKQVVERDPDRVLAIYIRDVSTPRRAREVQALATDVEAAGVPMQLVPDTEAAAEHAVAKEFIPESALPRVHRAKVSDEQAGTP
jgi:phosphatidate phosphatase APP1